MKNDNEEYNEYLNYDAPEIEEDDNRANRNITYDEVQEHALTEETSEGMSTEAIHPELPKRARYNAKIDRFLNNGIIITGVLLILVLIIAFLV